MDTYVYEAYGKKLYINLTNRCSNACEFCIRNGKEGLSGNRLWLEKEPTFEDVLRQLPKNLDDYDEITFCGFGEPTYNFDTLVKVGRYLSVIGKKVRLNTNGQGNLIQGRDITDDLIGAVDTVSISLNEADAERYQKICHCRFGEQGFDAMLEFARLCKEKGFRVILSVVDVIGEEQVKRCRALCEANGWNLRVRTYEK